MCNQLHKSLNALIKATQNTDSEIIVVDCASTDRTMETVMREFPDVKLIALDHHIGLSRAINKGISVAGGEYIVLVKPDVIVHKEAIFKASDFMDTHLATGGLGVRILDTDGNYLKESKKILPRTWIAFFKLTGLARQFPKSRLTERFVYHAEDEFETTEVDVLSSKFMVIRKSILDNIGLLDERFTGYGNNIDLSYRIRLAGYKNHYYPKTYIIDQQTVKYSRFSWVYLKDFYCSMIIFAVKYFFSLPDIKIKPLQELTPAYELKG